MNIYYIINVDFCKMFTIINCCKIVIQQPIYDINHVAFGRMTHTIVHIFFVYFIERQMGTLKLKFIKKNFQVIDFEIGSLVYLHNIQGFSHITGRQMNQCFQSIVIDINPVDIYLNKSYLNNNYIQFGKLADYLSCSIMYSRRVFILSSVKGPNRNRVQRD